MKKQQLDELPHQALETEMGGVESYETAVSLAQNAHLRNEWTEYLEQTRYDAERLTTAFGKLGLRADTESPGRKVVRFLGAARAKQARSATL